MRRRTGYRPRSPRSGRRACAVNRCRRRRHEHAGFAAERGIENGDLLSIESEHIRDQLGRKTRGGFTAVAYVSDIVKPGVTYTYFLYPGSPSNTVTSGDSALQPINRRYNFKLGRGTVTKIGTTDLATKMSFAPRNLAP